MRLVHTEPPAIPQLPFIDTHSHGIPGSSAGKEFACNAGDPGSIPGSGSSPGKGIGYPLQYSWASLETQMVKNPPAMWEIWVQSLGWEDPLEEGMATHSSILAWRIPWTEKPNELQPLRLQRVRHDCATKHSTGEAAEWPSAGLVVISPPLLHSEQQRPQGRTVVRTQREKRLAMVTTLPGGLGL